MKDHWIFNSTIICRKKPQNSYSNIQLLFFTVYDRGQNKNSLLLLKSKQSILLIQNYTDTANSNKLWKHAKKENAANI